jgi:hypothetical protein
MRIAYCRGTEGGMEAIVTHMVAGAARLLPAKRESLNDFSTLTVA